MNEVQAAGSMFWVMLPLIALPMGKRGRKQEEKAKLFFFFFEVFCIFIVIYYYKKVFCFNSLLQFR
jgi:hypothetical protein